MTVSAKEVINSLFNPEDIVNFRVFDDKKNGVFSGVLLESGPQAIFLINENSPDKVYVMKELIAPFIFEFYNSVINK